MSERALAPVRGAKCGERAAHATEGGLSTQRVARVGRMAQRRARGGTPRARPRPSCRRGRLTSLETEDLKVRPREQHASQGRELGGGRHLATRRAPPTAPAVLKFTTSSHKLFGRSPFVDFLKLSKTACRGNHELDSTSAAIRWWQLDARAREAACVNPRAHFQNSASRTLRRRSDRVRAWCRSPGAPQPQQSRIPSARHIR